MNALLDLSMEELDLLSDVLDDSEDDGLHDLTRSISGQYVEVIASFVRTSFKGEDIQLPAAQIEAAQAALKRLAIATGDDDLDDSLTELARLLPEAKSLGGQRRERYLREMREWVLQFAELLTDRDAKHLKALVRFDDRSQPLLHRLMEVYGIGPRRLERLYCAGLFAIDTLVPADPIEVAQVTGMSVRLARSVIFAAGRFDLLRRQSAARTLLDRTRDAIALAREPRPDPGLVYAMRCAHQELEQALSRLAVEKQ